MNRRLALTIGLGVLAGARTAAAQEAAAIGYQGLPQKASGEQATGINVAEGMLLHVGAGAGNQVLNNFITANHGEGIEDDGVGTTLSGNTSRLNRQDCAGTDATLVWSSLAGQAYTVQYKNNLEDAVWTDLTPNVTAGGATATKTDSVGTQQQRFYRISVVCP